MKACPLCTMELMRPIGKNGDRHDVLCSNCGGYDISNSMLTEIENRNFSSEQLAILSYVVKRTSTQPLVTTHFANSVLTNAKLPGASGLMDNLLLHISSELHGPGELIHLKAVNLRAVLGALSSQGVRWAIVQAMGLGLLAGKVGPISRGEGIYK